MASTQGLEPGPRWVFFIGILSGNLFGEEELPTPHPPPKLEGVEWRVKLFYSSIRVSFYPLSSNLFSSCLFILSVKNLFIHSLIFFFFIQSVVLDVPSHHEKAFEVS